VDEKSLLTRFEQVDERISQAFARGTHQYTMRAGLLMEMQRVLESVFQPSDTVLRRWEDARLRESQALQSDHGGKLDFVQDELVEIFRTGHRIFKEEPETLGAAQSKRALRAYEGLDLHPAIECASGALYRDGHYANAIEDAVKALNKLVCLRSGESSDGTSLMEKVFSPKNPILKFNSLTDESDRDEQKGFMMLFSGAVAGLRNPRAHKLIKDDPERALEFIAFVSLLAKLLDGTNAIAQKSPCQPKLLESGTLATCS